MIHELLLGPDSGTIRSKYLQECQIMAELDHPNVTKFIGVCFLPALSSLPVLLMEMLERSLDDYLENVPYILFETKRSILEDVARGLVYLHTQNPPIIHRDLTSRNILLTAELTAKITDFGNSRLVNFQPGRPLPTQLPGTLVYMPPEALTPSDYGPSLDIFSFGHLALFTALQV